MWSSVAAKGIARSLRVARIPKAIPLLNSSGFLATSYTRLSLPSRLSRVSPLKARFYSTDESESVSV